ncbi:hypothetical protein C2869_16805 [Saccharobesus litoralis]|uniref:TonB C-terminal domain-containing protein n=1 Tax=Saccharobesus litoralis TaxID=2172099 RepID=A0A2S0VV53_9ALTE|nr:energy transducer TonB [Saccharobesus litoralis]AWB67980.1 hypothetical protein C2869_16805 [Saccharobesus litoralis]
MKKSVLAILAVLGLSQAHANMFAANQAINDKDFSKAKAELTKSAQVGNPEAQFKLGILNYQGLDGTVDKQQAMAWFFLASQYDYPQAINFAGEIFQSLDKSQQAKASKMAEEFVKQYGKTKINEQYFPYVSDSVLDDQVINKRSKINVKGKFYVNSDSRARSHNQAAIDRAIRSYGSNPGAINNLSKTMINPDSGRVEVVYDARRDGRVEDVEIIFSWPRGRFDKEFVKSIETSKLRPAKRKGKNVEQYGMFSHVNVYYQGTGGLREGYPHLFKQFKSLQKRAEESASAKYQYACFLRAYNDLFNDQELEAFEPVLREAAEAGQPNAQYDYALYQIYRNDDIEDGIEWLNKAAKHGLLQAEYRLGDILYQSPSPYVKQDIAKAQFWLGKAAERNHFKAQQKLAEIRFKQENVDKDFVKLAIDWLEEIEDENAADPNTYYLLAKAHELIGEKSQASDYIEEAIDEAKAAKWNTKAWLKYQSQLEG